MFGRQTLSWIWKSGALLSESEEGVEEEEEEEMEKA